MIVSESWIARNVLVLQEIGTGTVGVRMPGTWTTYFARCADFTNYGHYQHKHTTDQVTGSGSMGIARSLFMQLGGFDESLDVGEDIDLCARVRHLGYRTRYCPEIVAVHDHQYVTLRHLLSYNYQHGRRTDLRYKIRRQRDLKNRLLALVCSPGVFLLIFPFIALAATLHIVILNISESGNILVYAPCIFLGKLVYEYGILVRLFEEKGRKV
jgi:GT2 family glycosyltransferase